MNLWPPPSWDVTDGALGGRRVEAEEGGSAGLVVRGGGGGSLSPAVPADILGARLGALLFARVDGTLPQSLSETVGDDAVDVLPEDSWVCSIGAASDSFCSDARVWPGCFSNELESGGGIGIWFGWGFFVMVMVLGVASCGGLSELSGLSPSVCAESSWSAILSDRSEKIMRGILVRIWMQIVGRCCELEGYHDGRRGMNWRLGWGAGKTTSEQAKRLSSPVDRNLGAVENDKRKSKR